MAKTKKNVDVQEEAVEEVKEEKKEENKSDIKKALERCDEICARIENVERFLSKRYSFSFKVKKGGKSNE